MKNGPAAWFVALTMAACAPAPSSAVDVRNRFESAGVPPADVRVLVQPEHRRDADRYLRAAIATLDKGERWLGPFAPPSLTLVDPEWRTASGPPAGAIVLERTPWWSTPPAMKPEIAASSAVSRRIWLNLVDTSALPAWFVDGLVEYSMRRAVAPMFERHSNPPGYASLEARHFGMFVPKTVRVRLLAETDGGPMPAYRARPTVEVVAQPKSAEEALSLTAKTVLTLGTLERWLGSPVFDDVFTEIGRASRRSKPTMADVERIASEVSGQNLSWFFDQTFRSSSLFDYGVDRLTSERQPDGAYVTTLVARRYGDAVFAGTAAPRVGPFESGRGVSIRVTFGGGERRTDHWDGRDRDKTFVYRSPARATSAEVDPARTILLDLNRTNNSRTLAPSAGATATRWAGRWIIWLQDVLLSYVALL